MLFAESEQTMWGTAQLAITSLTGLATIYLMWRIKKSEEKAEDKAEKLDVKIQKIDANVQTIETATNSMKDALVKKTEEEGLQRGANEERARADERDVAKAIVAATLAADETMKVEITAPIPTADEKKG